MYKEIKLAGTPSWCGTALEQLDLEWSREEELELERYYWSVLKNVANEAGPPRQGTLLTVLLPQDNYHKPALLAALQSY